MWHQALAKRICILAGLIRSDWHLQLSTSLVSLQGVERREGQLQDQLHTCNASLAQIKREKEEVGISLHERSLQLAELQRQAADKARALDSECEKLSRERHKRQRIEEDNKVRVAGQHTADIPEPAVSTLCLLRRCGVRTQP